MTKGGRRAISILAVLVLAAGLSVPPASVRSQAQSRTDEGAGRDMARAAVERLLIAGTPASLAKALETIRASAALGEQERSFLESCVLGVGALLYPPPSANSGKPLQVTPAVYRNGGSSFRTEDESVAMLLDQAKSGQAAALPPGLEGKPLAELMACLPIFRSTSRETAKLSRDAAQKLAQIAPGSVIHGLVRALEAERRDDFAAAASGYRAILDVQPEVWPAALGLGRVYLALGRDGEALRALEPLRRDREGSYDFCIHYFLALYREGRIADAAELQARAAASYPDTPEILEAAAHVLVSVGDFAKAQATLDALSKARAGKVSAPYLLLRTKAYSGQGKRDEAISWARKAHEFSPQDPEAKVLLAGALFDGPESGHAEARALAESAIALFRSPAGPRSSIATAMRAESEREAVRLVLMDSYVHGDWMGASVWVEKATGTGVDRSILATILRRSGRSAEAVSFARDWFASSGGSEASAEAWLRALASSPGGAYASNLPTGTLSDALGARLAGGIAGGMAGVIPGSMAGGQGDLALLRLAIGLLSAAGSPEMKSFLYYIQGCSSPTDAAAAELFRAALMERADNVEALVALAELHVRAGEAEKARFYTRQARSIGSRDDEVLVRLSALESRLAQP